MASAKPVREGMRVRIDNFRAADTVGVFIGLLESNGLGCDRCGSDGMVAVVREISGGLMLRVLHPSRITPYDQPCDSFMAGYGNRDYCHTCGEHRSAHPAK